MPSPRETILQSPFDSATLLMLLAVFDEIWRTCEDKSDLNGYRLAGSIIDIARSGQRSREAIHCYAAHTADCHT